MLKRVIILLIVLITIFGCAKKSTELKENHILSLTATIPLVGNPLDMDAADTLVYVAEDQGGVSRINLNNFTKTWYSSFYSTGSNIVNMVKIRNISVVKPLNLLFAKESGGSDAIRIINTTNPDSLRLSVPITGGTSDIQEMQFEQITPAGGQYTFEGAYTSVVNGIRDVSYGTFGVHVTGFPPYYAETRTFNPPANANGFFMTAQYMFVAADQRGLFIYNRSNSALVGQLDLPGNAQKVKVMGNYAYLTCKQDGLQIIDITDPAAPVKVGSFDTSGYATNLDVWENHVVVSSGGGGVYVFDVTNPANPVLDENITNCGYVNTVKYHQNKVLVASRDLGLLIYNILP